jgi:hypothetical protein
MLILKRSKPIITPKPGHFNKNIAGVALRNDQRCCLCATLVGPFVFEERLTGRAFSPQT